MNSLIIADREGSRDEEALGSVLNIGDESPGFVFDARHPALVAVGVILVLVYIRCESSSDGVAGSPAAAGRKDQRKKGKGQKSDALDGETVTLSTLEHGEVGGGVDTLGDLVSGETRLAVCEKSIRSQQEEGLDLEF